MGVVCFAATPGSNQESLTLGAAWGAIWGAKGLYLGQPRARHVIPSSLLPLQPSSWVASTSREAEEPALFEQFIYPHTRAWIMTAWMHIMRVFMVPYTDSVPMPTGIGIHSHMRRAQGCWSSERLLTRCSVPVGRLKTVHLRGLSPRLLPQFFPVLRSWLSPNTSLGFASLPSSSLFPSLSSSRLRKLPSSAGSKEPSLCPSTESGFQAARGSRLHSVTSHNNRV